MKFNIIETNGVAIAEVESNEILIRETQNALDLMASCSYSGASCIVLSASNFTPGFFDLKTGIAGDILQKFSTYNLRLAIVGDFSDIKSKSLHDFILESNKYGRINFVKSKEEAIKKLCL